MCNHHLNYILRQVGFKQSSVDECVWYKYKTIFFYYVDDDIFMRSDSKAIDREIKDMEKSWLYIEYKGNIEDYLGANVEDKDNSKINLTQPQIINSINNDFQIPKNTAPRQTLALSTKILCYNAASPPFDERFNYCTVVGKLDFLEKSTCPDIAYATHLYTLFSHDMWEYHGDAIIHLVK